MLDWLERNRGYILSTMINLIIVGLVLLRFQSPRAQPVAISTPTVGPTPTQVPLRVYVCGAVQSPDVYTLAPGAIVKEAVLAAGGPAQDADLDRLNLALYLQDGDQVYVPYKVDLPVGAVTGGSVVPIPAPAMPVSAPVTPVPLGEGRAKININRATAAELETLPGIGPALAGRILDYRSQHGFFASVDELIEVRGIGEVVLAGIRDLVTVR